MPKKTTVPGSLKNVTCPETGKIIGFQFDVRLPRYRGNMVSLVNGYYVCVDGVEYPQESIRFILNGKGPRTFEELKTAVWEHWNYRDAATLLILKEGGLEKGDHEVIATISNFEQYGYFPKTDQYRVDNVVVPSANPTGVGQGAAAAFVLTIE